MGGGGYLTFRGVVRIYLLGHSDSQKGQIIFSDVGMSMSVGGAMSMYMSLVFIIFVVFIVVSSLGSYFCTLMRTFVLGVVLHSLFRN